ncbi:MAG: alpha/beta fold hydrolase [Okeania sp. SIO3B5]|uniref:alpha/beta fold hydrolase n=1 Tax=Okeania sp. SIO3B5 TaxID=2607811 RepID=UPI001401AA18|nr:alpha/beta fold hydrolase [Okeania sp. SIO3B5]NEO53491.1 alpha/beta fold hydrolase [Okeania sp. SIO3B5]
MLTTSTSITASLPGSYWQWRDQSIYYVCAGKSDPATPPILLIHGFGASTDHWRKNIGYLSQFFQVWAIDLLGFGRSTKANWQYSGQLWREQLNDFITEVIGKPVVLAGNSLGGYAALCVATQYPSSTAGLILLNSAGPFSESQPTAKPPLWRKVISQSIKWLLLQDWPSFLLFQWTRRRSTIRKTLHKVYLDQSAVTDQLVEDIYRPSCDPGAAKVFASIFKTPSGEKVDVLLGQLKCPLLMLWGKADPWINTQSRSAQFRKYYPQLTEYFLEAGHCPHDEVPEQVNKLIKEWVLSEVRSQKLEVRS